MIPWKGVYIAKIKKIAPETEGSTFATEQQLRDRLSAH
jgi:hypothetical protein